jgi:hypothetical protein
MRDRRSDGRPPSVNDIFEVRFQLTARQDRPQKRVKKREVWWPKSGVFPELGYFLSTHSPLEGVKGMVWPPVEARGSHSHGCPQF